jgi:iron complex transport system permease protein
MAAGYFDLYMKKVNPFRPSRGFVIPGLWLLLVASVIASLMIGRYTVSWADAFYGLQSAVWSAGQDSPSPEWTVLINVRMPRILIALFCGAGLSLSGAAMQGIFRNPLVGPDIVGVTAGASLGGVLALELGCRYPLVVSCAFVLGLLALCASFGLSRLARTNGSLGPVLSGLVIASFCHALVGVIQMIADPDTKLPTLVYWLLGGFSGASFDKAWLVGSCTLAAGSILIALRWRINLLSLQQTDARALGVQTEQLRWLVVVLVALIVAAQVAVSGGIGWVGVIIPHLARMLVGANHTRLLPVSALLGGIFLLLIDDLARSVSSQEIPVGLLCAILGAPIFAFVFWKSHSSGLRA